MRTTTEDLTACFDPDRVSAEALHLQHFVQRQRCEARLKLSPADIEKMIAGFVDSHGSVTTCPTAYALPSRQYRLRKAS
jgi:hypothetical protein